jgi:two-component system, sensor histidine kinase
MKNQFDEMSASSQEELRNRILGFGDSSGRKSYFPELKKRLEELNQAKERAEIANRSKSEFLANMSHEIRNPLSSILGFTEVLSKTELTFDQKKYLKKIETSSAHLLKIINAVLDLSKMEAGQVQTEIIPFDVRKLTQDLFGILAKDAIEKGLAVECIIDPNLPPFILSDPLRIRQILVNLLSNAIKFTHRGYVRLNLQIDTTTSDSSAILFEISDSGIGIAKEHLSCLYSRFSQLDASVTRNFGGSGLGLNISKKLVELLGGEIKVTSTLNEGSSFKVYIPISNRRHEPLEASLPAKTSKEHLVDDLDLDIKPLDILVVEDNLDNQYLMDFFLKDYPFTLHFADNGRNAFDKFKEFNFDIVLMDMEMPIVDGYSATRKMRAWEATQNKIPTPIIAQTAHAVDEKIKEAHAAGCNDYLTKPLNPKILIETILKFSKKY